MHTPATHSAKLFAQVECWRNRLLDIGNRNPLINTSFHPTRGVVEFEHPSPESVWRKLVISGEAGSRALRFPWKRELVPPPARQAVEDTEPFDLEHETDAERSFKDWNPSTLECLASVKLRSDDLLTVLGDRALDRRIRNLDGYAKLSVSEQGIHCLFLAFGFIKWFESTDSKKELRSPLILVPATFSRETSDSQWELQEAEDDVVDNLCLRQRFKQDFGLELPPLPELDQLEEQEARLKFLAEVRNAISKNARWGVEDRCCLGRFAFPKVAMWQDLGDHVNSIASSVICQSIAGQAADGPQLAFGDPSSVPNAEQLDDQIGPGEIKAILDCDSSQLEAIVAAKKGISFVLDGPPGTGKSQTIANIIADALSVGKRVLFVSEKVAALDVVKRRLDDCGLGDFCLECHSSKANRKAVLEELKWCLEIPLEAYPDPNPKLAELQKQRQALNDYVRVLHHPQQPIGLSMYELHGSIARLTRLNMLGRSRIEFPAPETVTRGKLDNWIQLLRLATEHEHVLATFADHPWQGCRLTTQPLALKTDIQYNFTLLAEQAEQLAQEMRPLEEVGLIPAGTTRQQLNEWLAKLEAALTVPDVPPVWFASPRQISRALSKRHGCHGTKERLRHSLAAYVDDVGKMFSDDVVQLADMRQFGWLERLTSPLPINFDDCRKTLSDYGLILRGYEEALSALEHSLKQLIAELRLPIRADLPVWSVGKLLQAARLVATGAPFRPSWFEPQQATILADGANQALKKLESLKRIETAVSEPLNSDALLSLAREVANPLELQHNWELVRAKIPASQLERLEDYFHELNRDHQWLLQADADLQTLRQALQWSDDFTPTFGDAQAIVEALPVLLDAGAYNGSWSDSAICSRVKQQIESALLDLAEAQEIRKDLEDRFSHRAFLPAAQSLIERGARFASWWSRLVGGYAKYRVEVADLYKSAVPETKSLLGDISQLATFHKRMQEVNGVYSELKALLPSAISPEQLDSWRTAQATIRAFEAFISAVPQVTPVLPAGAVTVSMRSNDPLVTRLTDLLKHTRCSEVASSRGPLNLTDVRIKDALAEVSSLQYAVRQCLAVHRSCLSNYRTSPSMQQLLDDCAVARDYAGERNAVEALFTTLSPDLPLNSDPFQPLAWKSAIRGVESAEKLVKTFGRSPLLIETLCTSGRVNARSLSEVLAATESAWQRTCIIFSEQAPFINLTSPGEPTTELKKRTATALKACAAAAAQEFESISGLLTKLLAVLKPGQTIPLDRLTQDAKAIKELRQNQEMIDNCNAVLSKFGLEHPDELSDEELRICEFIKQAPDELLDSPLARAVATDPHRRSQIQELLHIARRTTEDMKAPGKFFDRLFQLDARLSSGCLLSELPLCELPTVLRKLITEADTVDEWILFTRWKEQMTKAGFSVVISELLTGQYAPGEAVDAVCAKLYQGLFEHFVSSLPHIGEFDGIRHEQIRERYRTLDEWEIKASAARVREFQLCREDRPRVGWLAPITSELGILKRETEKKRRHMPLRKLFNAVPGVLQRLKPCIMMSPLSVSTFLQADTIRFDLVIFDEASQVFPWDAIGAIYRGSQLIVAGDDKQLPPTSFFSRADLEADDEEEDIGDFESILSLCKSVSMPNKRLRWHYRSRREPLIAFSNRHFYDGDLVTFPSVRDAARDAVQLIHVPDGLWLDRKNLPEARRVAELVVEHFRDKPEKSLGVIAFNATQQQAVEDALYELRRSSAVIDALLKDRTHEPLFIKNLENVQGDERDVILLSFGYGKNENGRFLKNFGPLSKPGGERRLNVAVTRAREAVALIASVRSSDMDLSGSTSHGAQLLKAYLEYAEHGVDSLSRSIVETQSKCESPFEEEVATALLRHGLEPVPQVGCGGFRIDLALKHPGHPGVYCLGIECDGATYHSSKTARDRDRIRQSILEGLGWRICRVWSTDWIRNPDLQIQRILYLYEQISAIPPDFGPNYSSKSEPDFEDLQPQYTTDDASKAITNMKIDDVPTQQIVDTSLRIVMRVGGLDWSDLVALTARELGFARTGKKIRERIEAILHEQIRQGSLHRVAERIAMPQ